MAVTIKDVAQRAGVSYSTVSRALNGKSVVNDTTKEEITRIAREMGYVPNIAATNLKKRRSYILGLYFSTISNMSSPIVLHDMITAVYDEVGSRYSVLIKGIDIHQKGTLNPTLVDGLIILSQRDEDLEFIQEAIDRRIPLVVVNRQVPLEVPNVLTDECDAIYRTMKYLLSCGHRKIAVIEGTQGLSSTNSRHRGWTSAIEEEGLDPEQIPVAVGNYRYMSGYQAGKQLLSYHPTAILSFNDEMAVGAERAIYEAGLTVPQDVSLIGFDNWNMAAYSNLKLTTIERSMYRLARRSTRILIDEIEHGVVRNEKIFLTNRFIERDSVRVMEENE